MAAGLSSKNFLVFFDDFHRDRVRTVVNVLGDAFGAGIVHNMSQDELNAEQTPKNAPSVTCEIVPVPKEN